MGTERQGIVDYTGKPIRKPSHPIGIYARDGKSAGGTSMLKSAGLRKLAAADNALMTPEVRNPLLNIVNFFLPYNYRVLAQWIRYYDKFHPTVGNCLDMHGFFPISKFDLKLDHDDDKVRRVYENCVDSCDLFNKMLDMSREYELLGEVYPYLHWNDSWGFFDNLVILNPDFIHVDMHPLAFNKDPIIKLEPDALLKVIATSTNPEDIEIRQDMDPMVIAAVLTEQNIRLDPFSVSQIARKSSPYEPRGTSIVLRAIKDLLYEDKLREAQYAVADGMITPKVIWKVGDPQNNYMPNDAELHDFRQLLQDQAHDPLAAVITHYGLSIDVIGFTGKILPIVPEFEFVEDRILQALYTSKEMMHGQGPAFANVSVAMEILEGRYLAKREKLEEFLRKKMFSKIAYLNQFYEPLTEAQQAHGIRPSMSERKLNIPTLDWKQKLSLVEDDTRKQMIIGFRNLTMQGKAPQVSMKTVYNLLGLNQKEEQEALRSEAKIQKELDALYGQSSPVANPTTFSGDGSQMNLPTMTPPERPQSQPGRRPTQASLRKREAWQNSESMKKLLKAGKGRVPTIAAPPVSFLEENGRLAKLESILDETEKQLVES